jgi:hypothetical protein
MKIAKKKLTGSGIGVDVADRPAENHLKEGH